MPAKKKREASAPEAAQQRTPSDCVEKCLKRLSVLERQLIMQRFDATPRNHMDLSPIRGLSTIRVKTIRARLTKCIKKCLQEIEETSSR